MICANLAVAVDFKEGATTGKVVKNVEESPDKKILNWGNLQKNSAKNFLSENPDVVNATELDLEYLDEELGSLIIGIIARLKKLEKLTLIGCTLECEWIEVMCEMFSVLNPELKNLHIDRNSVYIDLAKLSAVNPNLTITQTKSTDVILKEKEKKKELEEQNENNLKLKNFLANEPKKKKNSFDSDDSFTSTEAVKNEGIEYPTKQ